MHNNWILRLGNQGLDEHAAYLEASKHFSSIVPPTYLCRTKLGSIQRRVNAPTAYSLGGNLFSLIRTTDGLWSLANLIAFDYLFGAGDRHGNNWLVGESGQVWAIDHDGFGPANKLTLRNALRPAFQSLLIDDEQYTPTLIANLQYIFRDIGAHVGYTNRIALAEEDIEVWSWDLKKRSRKHLLRELEISQGIYSKMLLN